MSANSQLFKFSNSQILFAVLVWSLLLLRFGYRFGTGDHVEYLPYVLYLGDHSLYPHDYYLQGVVEKIPNERSVVCVFLSLFKSHLETVCFILQFLTTVTLIVGLQKLGKAITQSSWVTRLAILINFFLLFNKGLGDVELYSDAVQGSSISVALIAFAFYYFFSNKFIRSTVLMSIASIIHPVEGLTVFMVLTATLFYFAFINQATSKKIFFQSVFIYVLTAGIFIAAFLFQKFDGTAIPNHELFFRIYHEFRHAHHYVFFYFPFIDKILFVFFISVLLLGSFGANSKLFVFTVIALLGTLIYIFLTDAMHIPLIADLQFYKVSQWIKFFGVLILVKTLLKTRLGKVFESIKHSIAILILPAMLIFFVALIIIKPDFIDRPGIYHEYGNNWKTKNDMVDISIKISKQVNKNAVFIQPFDCTELKYFGRVSSWVDWKAFVKDQSKIEEWYRRIQLVYGININDREKGFQLSAKANYHFDHLTANEIEECKQAGVTNILISKKYPPVEGKLILQNNTYAVYQL